MESNTGWCKLNDSYLTDNYNSFKAIELINPSTFIFIDRTNSICKYNHLVNNGSHIKKLLDHNWRIYTSAAFRIDRNSAYILQSSETQTSIFNYIHVFDCNSGQKMNSYNLQVAEQLDKYKMIFIQDYKQLLLISGNVNDNIYVWNDTEKKLDVICTTAVNASSTTRVEGYSFIYLKSKDHVMMMGGYDIGNDAVGTIWRYSVFEKTWERLKDANGNIFKLPERLTGFVCLLTRDERFILIFGGSVGLEKWNKIYYLDLYTMKLNESAIECPGDSESIAMLTPFGYVHLLGEWEDEWDGYEYGHWIIKLTEIIPGYGDKIMYGDVLLRGYLKQICKDLNIELSDDIIKLIYQWH